MVLFEAALVLGLVWLIVFATIRLLPRAEEPGRPALRAGLWRTAHYDVQGETRVVLQKVSPTGANVIDEHVIATLRVDDPEYDAKFLSAMATARERRALFDAENQED
jgi:hypothetical protein